MKTSPLQVFGWASSILVFVLFLGWGVEAKVVSRASESDPTATSSPLGKKIYEEKCAACHGLTGKGDGVAAVTLSPKPRDLTTGRYKFRSTESGSIPTDDDIIRTIREGLHGTSMPAWKSFIDRDSLKALVAYVKSLSPRFSTETPKGVMVGLVVPISPATIAAGKRVYEKLQCGVCHGSDGEGGGATTTEFFDDWGQRIVATNLTEPWTFRGGSNVRDIYLRFRTGIDGTPMPSYKGTATNVEMWNLAQYVASMARKPVWSMNEQEVRAHYAKLEAQAIADPIARGRYLVSSLGCIDCHTPTKAGGALTSDLLLAGGQRWDIPPFGTLYTANLTPDVESGIGSKSDDQLVQAIRRGVRSDGTRMLPFPMPWPALAQLSERDVKAIIAYLRSLPPVKNKIPDRETPNIFSYLWGKFRLLILKEQMPAYIHYGNAGSSGAISAHLLSTIERKEGVQ